MSLHVFTAELTPPSPTQCHPGNAWTEDRYHRDLCHWGRSSGARCVYISMVDSHDDEEPAATPILPPPATLLALDQQNTAALRTEARRYAESRLPFVRGAGRPIPKNYADELVDDAITDTWLGIANWDPTRCSLLVHIRGEILDRTSKEARHGRRYRRISFDVAANDPKDARAIHHHLTHASQGDCSPIMFAALVFRIANALKDLAQADPDAQAMLACWRDGVTVRGEVLARTQLTPAAYKATRKRLLTLRDKLPPELRDAAHDLLRSAS